MARQATRAEAGDGAATSGSAARGYVVALIVGGFLSVAGAFGSGEAPILMRLLYWLPLMLAGAAWGAFCARRVFDIAWLEERPWLRAGLLTLIIGLPFSLVAWWATAAFFEFPLRLAALPYTVANVLVVSAVITALNLTLGGRLVTTRAAPPGAEPPRFLQRLPPKLRGAEIHAVEAEDHYLRIHTDRGSDLILLRLSDAVAELEGLEGAQTHRSWWVAKGAVTDVERGDGRAVLTLKNGTKAPVSRTYARGLRDAGWW